ncbi:hypothetical protein QWY75_10475 [Pontixanthobacter aestiaquae]|uniref:Uncharacterized protein n=1 Tax=Pontixanthobacter aestiaquae TaxID=1509367 RepID=A0A844Z4W8_9SPHN|nr:hypothetical protein [Pontixanthobacter aestiaquae]MDN3646623.1 hypothetical protein [Pontixanthobacter aestiaquae]MXO82392.1 hypothetical protein [Pontixanthobacter aestiaquae]
MARPMKRLVVMAAACFGMGVPAAATPPDVITIEDRLFGISATHAFLLREASDNLGSHYSDRRETFLVAINLTTEEEELWPVYRATRSTDFGDSGADDTPVIEVDPRAGMIDPYAVLEERGGMPLSERAGESFADLIDNGRSITITRSDGSKFIRDKANAFGRLQASTSALAERVANTPRLGSRTTRQFYDARSIIADTCRYSALPGSHRFYTAEPVQLVRIACHDGEEMEVTSLIQVVRVEARQSAEAK